MHSHHDLIWSHSQLLLPPCLAVGQPGHPPPQTSPREAPHQSLNLHCHPHSFQAHWSLGWRRRKRHPQTDPRGLFWGMERGVEQKAFSNNFPIQKGKACHKSCLEWVLCVALFLKIFFQEVTFRVVFVGEGIRRKRRFRGRGEEGGDRRTPGNLTSETFPPFY